MRGSATAMLSAEEERRLVAIMRGGDPHEAKRARDALIVAHLPLACKAVKRLGKRRDYEDLEQEAAVALIEATRRFDPNRGARFVTCALWAIRNRLGEYAFRNVSLVKRGTTNEAKDQWRRQFRIGEFPYDVSTDRPVTSADGGVLGEWGDRIVDGDAIPADLAFDGSRGDARARAALKANLATLSLRERVIVRARWPEDGPIVSLEILADHFGISRERVRQIEASALEKIGAGDARHNASGLARRGARGLSAEAEPERLAA